MSEKYSDLEAVLQDALARVTDGKGAERHANGRAFSQQPMVLIGELVGIGFPLGQAVKKSQEAARFAMSGDAGRAEIELLDAVAYLAGAVVILRRSAGE